QTEALIAFGTKVGLAFQIIDDVLDYTAEADSLGKPVGSDLREGKLTLPLIYALQRARTGDRARLVEALERPSALQNGDIAAVGRIIARCDGFTSSRELATSYVTQARRDLEMIPSGAPRDGLAYLAGKAVERTT